MYYALKSWILDTEFICVPLSILPSLCHHEIFVFPRGRSRSRSRSYSPSHSRRHDRAGHADNGHRSKPRAPKIEYITEFGGSPHHDDQKLGVSPPSSPFQADVLNRSEHSTFNSCKIDWTMFSAAAYLVLVLVT